MKLIHYFIKCLTIVTFIVLLSISLKVETKKPSLVKYIQIVEDISAFKIGDSVEMYQSADTIYINSYNKKHGLQPLLLTAAIRVILKRLSALKPSSSTWKVRTHSVMSYRT